MTGLFLRRRIKSNNNSMNQEINLSIIFIHRNKSEKSQKFENFLC